MQRILLGKDDSIYYVHFCGYDDADIAEFICLTLCDHRVLSNSSTFGRLADELNGKKGRYTFYQGDIKSKPFWYFHVKRMLTGRDEKKRLDQWDIRKFARLYKTNNRENVQDWRERVDNIVRNVASKDRKEFRSYQ